MKTKKVTMLAIMALGVFMLSQCQSDDSTLKNESVSKSLSKTLKFTNGTLENGNYVVDDNYLVKSTIPVSDDDMKLLQELDLKYADITKGKLFLTYIVNTQQIKVLTKLDKLTQISRLQKINQIQKGCFEVAKIDWTQYKDLKVSLDKILNKYSPLLINENVSIIDNEIVNKAVKMKATDVSSMYDMTKFGIDDADICGDYMGLNKYSRVLYRVNNPVINLDIEKKFDVLIQNYK